MNETEKSAFHEIIDFAIEREQDAIAFYEHLMHLPSFDSMTPELNVLKRMEERHVNKLLHAKEHGETHHFEKDAQSLSLAEYLVPSPNFEELTYQDLVIIAMRRELVSENLYKRLSEEAGSAALKTLFLDLSYEEGAHRLHFEKIYDGEVLTEN